MNKNLYSKVSGYKKKRLNKINAIYTSPNAGMVLVNYSETHQLLEVEFVGGRVYHFLEVPLVVWQECKWVAKSGNLSSTFINDKVRGQFDYEVVK